MPDGGYIPGQPWGICDRCCEKRRLRTMSREWTGLRVCPDCFDPRPPQLDPPKVGPEGVPLPNSRPRPPDIFVTDNQVQPDDL